jgi:hypothetical protein
MTITSNPVAGTAGIFTDDTLFRTGTAIHGRDGIRGRDRPSHSKPRIAFRFEYAGQVHNAIYGRFDDGRIAEIFLDGFEDTSARLASLLLQHGVSIETVRRSIHDGPLAVVLDRLMAINGGPRSASYRWLQKVERRQTLNRRRTTATFKHWAEQDEGEYTSVEQFHEAAIALGFRLQPIRGTLNAWINIAEPRKTKRTYRR